MTNCHTATSSLGHAKMAVPVVPASQLHQTACMMRFTKVSDASDAGLLQTHLMKLINLFTPKACTGGPHRIWHVSTFLERGPV